jgi:hypothetical protein
MSESTRSLIRGREKSSFPLAGEIPPSEAALERKQKRLVSFGKRMEAKGSEFLKKVRRMIQLERLERQSHE